MDARRVRRATHHRQYVIPQALFRLPRSLQHHPRERIAHVDGDEGRMAPADRPFRFRNGPQRLPLDLPAGRANRHGLGDRVCGDEPAMQWRVTVEGPRCRFLVFGHLVLGEQEFGPAGRIEIDSKRKRFTFRPDLNDRWGQQYPEAVYRLVTSTPGRVEAIGGDELLYVDGKRRSGGYVAIRTKPTNEFVFAVVGSMTDTEAGRRAFVKIREAGRRSRDAQACRSLLAQPHPWRSGDGAPRTPRTRSPSTRSFPGLRMTG